MDRYDDLDLDLECDGGGGGAGGGSVAERGASGVFKGMFKKSTKSAKEDHTQATLSIQNTGLSASSDSLTENKPSKEKSGVFGGILKRSPHVGHTRRPSQDLLDKELSASNDSLSDKSTVKEKAAMFGGMLKRSPKAGHRRRPSQDLLDKELSASNDSLSDKSTAKESGGMFSGILKKTKRTQSQDDLSEPGELSGSKDNLSVNSNTKESGGVFGGMFKKSPKPSRAQSQDDLSEPEELSGSKENISGKSNTKESGGVFGGMFKKKPSRAQSQDDLSEPGGELSGSKENLSGNNTKESGGMFGGMFKKSSKPFGARAQSQEDLTGPSKELSGSTDNLSETKEKRGIFGVFKKLGAKTQSQEDLTADGELSGSNDSLIEKSSKDKEKTEQTGDSNEKPKAKQNGFSAMMKNTFHIDKQDRKSDSDSEEDDGEGQQGQKQNKFAEAMTKINPFKHANKYDKQSSSEDEDAPADGEKSSSNKQKASGGAMSKLFRSATKKDAEDAETLKENEKQAEEKPKGVKSNMSQQREGKDRSERPLVPPRRTREAVISQQEMKATSTNDKPEPRGTEDDQMEFHNSHFQSDEKNGAARRLQKQETQQNQSDDEAKEGDEVKAAVSKPTQKKRPKHNPFMPRDGTKLRAASDDEGLKEEEDGEGNKDEAGEDKTQTKVVKKPKRHNPFLPRVKPAKKPDAENEGENRTLFDQLEDFRVDSGNPEDDQDLDLMEWWNTVESWEDTPQDEDMTEKEEAKAFAVTADKVQKGIRVFNKLFSERGEVLWQHVIDLNTIADSLDKFSKKTKIAQITGGSTSAIGGVATIAGLALAPVTMGTSLIVTAVGLGIATAGGLTSAGAGISNQVNNSMDRKKVEKIVQDYQEKILDLNKCLKFIKQGIENLKKFDLLRLKKSAYNRDFPQLSSSFYEDGAMAGKAILINANEIMRVVQIANVAGSTAARAVQIASMATGVLTGLFVGMDIYFVAKDSRELKKGAKSEFAKKIREVATQLHDGLVELNTIRSELQATVPEGGEGGDQQRPLTDGEPKEKDGKEDSSSEEDEIDRIKKAIKKDYENREYV